MHRESIFIHNQDSIDDSSSATDRLPSLQGNVEAELFLSHIDVCRFIENGVERLAIFAFGKINVETDCTVTIHQAAPEKNSIRSPRWLELELRVHSGVNTLSNKRTVSIFPPPCLVVTNYKQLLGVTIRVGETRVSISNKRFHNQLSIDSFQPQNNQSIGLGITPVVAYCDAMRKLHIDYKEDSTIPHVLGVQCERQDRDNTQFYVHIQT